MHANGAYGSYATRTADSDPKSAWRMSYTPSQGNTLSLYVTSENLRITEVLLADEFYAFPGHSMTWLVDGLSTGRLMLCLRVFSLLTVGFL
jgi:hypothetical protein